MLPNTIRTTDFLGEEYKDKFNIEALSGKKINAQHLTGQVPKILISIGHATPLRNINKLIEDNPEASKKFALFMDEVDFIDSEGTNVQKELVKLRQHCFCSYGVSATILDSTLKYDIDKGNVIILSTPENYKSIVNFKFIHLNLDNHLTATKNGDIMTDDLNIIPYLDEFACKKPHYVEMYEDEKHGTEDIIRPECHHPVDSLLRVATCHNPNLILLSYISTKYDFPVMYFQGGEKYRSDAGKVTAFIPREYTPITLMNGCKSRIQYSLVLDDEKKTKLDGIYHIFDNASPALVKGMDEEHWAEVLSDLLVL